MDRLFIKAMRIGLVDCDKKNFPNLALMKISAYHKSRGDTVEFINYFEKYDKVYLSKVFTFTSYDTTVINCNTDNIFYGGTGFSNEVVLPDEIEDCIPDYDLYPKKKGKDYAYGFLTRGCIRNCSWCVVPKKEG
ncbi:MAG: radical SAM protein, partial [Lentimicrobiaceae bacterium]|nr:radical SAM protein [Lentimicrobiaceae bacterium]